LEEKKRRELASIEARCSQQPANKEKYTKKVHATVVRCDADSKMWVREQKMISPFATPQRQFEALCFSLSFSHSKGAGDPSSFRVDFPCSALIPSLHLLVDTNQG